jgi:hypothetical protein
MLSYLSCLLAADGRRTYAFIRLAIKVIVRVRLTVLNACDPPGQLHVGSNRGRVGLTCAQHEDMFITCPR